jgi:hypothetical protein
VELIGLVILCVFFPLDCCLCSPGLYIKGQDWIWFFVVVVIFLHSLLTPHRTLVNTHKINKCVKLGSILLGVSREDDENIVSHSFNKILTFTSGHLEIRKWPKNYQNLLRTFIETFTPNFIQIRLVVLKKKIPEIYPYIST